MTRSVKLRPWQVRALERFSASGTDFLAVATPGAGKTTFALAAALADLAADPYRRLIVVAPTAHLKLQWAGASASFGLHLDPDWSSSARGLPADMHGVVVTYQQVAAAAAALRRLSGGAFVVLDEIHHAGDERAWGDGLRIAFEPAARRLALSGTPFRSDTNAIPFLRYVDDAVEPDFEYGYGDALAEGRVVRPVFFPRTDGRMEWTAPDGLVRSATFGDRLDRTASSQRLRTALSLHGEWLPSVLASAHDRLRLLRRTQPDAGGLVIATDQEHARGIAGLIRERHGVDATVAVSEDPGASARIGRYAQDASHWLVAVRMVSEGVDIPRLRVGVYATTTTTELFFRQAVGRFVRWRPGLPRQQAYLFLPDDDRLRRWAVQITEQRRHNLARRATERDEEEIARAVREQPADQLSLFAAISATPLAVDAGDDPAFDEVAAEPVDGDDGTLPILLAPPPPLPGVQEADAAGNGTTRQSHKRRLRAQNSDRVRMLARLTGLTHQKVNLELNQRAGIRTIDEATVSQLESRLRHADAWFRTL
ncbi:MAG TPA: DEAD/DEAH box helicase family protein [Euzebyales bacterium]|nr:DEAD/DEAH box helicase family protein [Euzebyales bacterium]